MPQLDKGVYVPLIIHTIKESMDKYIRNDDANDDLEVYRGEEYPNMSISSHKHQNLNVRGPKEEIEEKYGVRLGTLSDQEKKVLKLIMSGKSIRAAAKSMGIRQQTAQEYWNNIKEKMK